MLKDSFKFFSEGNVISGLTRILSVFIGIKAILDIEIAQEPNGVASL